MQREELHTPWTCWFVRILVPRLSLRRLLANFSMSHERVGLFFMISEASTCRQRTVVMSKSVFFSDKRPSFRVACFSNLYPLAVKSQRVKGRLCKSHKVGIVGQLLHNEPE